MDSSFDSNVFLRVKPICSGTVQAGLRAWVNAFRSLRGLHWMIDESPLNSSSHDLLIADLGRLEEAQQLSQSQKVPVAVWGSSAALAVSTPQLLLPVTVDGFEKFVKTSTSMAVRAKPGSLQGLSLTIARLASGR
jgi:hypothetical protein